MIELLPEEASDVEIQHRLRQCLTQHRPGKDEYGVKVPVIAVVRKGSYVRYVRLGHQFCVTDPTKAVNSLQEMSFNATFSDSLIRA